METVPHFPSFNAFLYAIVVFFPVEWISKHQVDKWIILGVMLNPESSSWVDLHVPVTTKVLASTNWITVSEKLKFKNLMTSMPNSPSIFQTLTHFAWWYNKSIIMLIVNENIILHQFLNHNLWQHLGTFSIFNPIKPSCVDYLKFVCQLLWRFVELTHWHEINRRVTQLTNHIYFM